MKPLAPARLGVAVLALALLNASAGLCFCHRGPVPAGEPQASGGCCHGPDSSGKTAVAAAGDCCQIEAAESAAMPAVAAHLAPPASMTVTVRAAARCPTSPVRRRGSARLLSPALHPPNLDNRGCPSSSLRLARGPTASTSIAYGARGLQSPGLAEPSRRDAAVAVATRRSRRSYGVRSASHDHRALSLGAFCLAPPLARAQAPAAPAEDDPVLESLVAEALARNPDLHAAQSAIAAAQTSTERARALPDPMVSVTYTNDGWAPSLGGMPMTTLGFMVSQSLPYSGKRDLRAALAASQARQFEPALARARLALEGAVRRAYYGLLLARELQALTDEQRELRQQIEVVARARYAVGQGAQPDVLRVQTEVTRIEQRAIEQAAEAEVRLAEINRLLARPLDTPLATPPGSRSRLSPGRPKKPSTRRAPSARNSRAPRWLLKPAPRPRPWPAGI